MAGIFGTDGVRARINTGSMRAESVVRLALAAGRWFADKTADDGRMTRPMVVIGKDTRLSGYMLESALVAGFTSIGINCRLLGPVPTAAVSYLTHSLRADFGVMISASHNPHHDNGIKLFRRALSHYRDAGCVRQKSSPQNPPSVSASDKTQPRLARGQAGGS